MSDAIEAVELRSGRSLTWLRVCAIVLVMLGGLSAAIGLTGLDRLVPRAVERARVDPYRDDARRAEIPAPSARPVESFPHEGVGGPMVDVRPPIEIGPPVSTAPQTNPPMVIAAQVMSRPSAEILDRFYPRRARERGVRGQATVRCLVSIDGKLEQCRVVQESPPEYGFGAAALRYAEFVEAAPQTVDGVAIDGGEISMSIVFVP